MSSPLNWTCPQCKRWTGERIEFTTIVDAIEHVVHKHPNRAVLALTSMLHTVSPESADEVWAELTQCNNEPSKEEDNV